MTTVVYPLASQSDYTELKFSLRSIDKYLPKPFEVVIIGEKVPEWINNVTWIHLPDIPNKKLLSVRRKILAGLSYSGGEILFMNDDFYFLRETPIPYFVNGFLQSCANAGSRQLQARLKELKKPARHYDLHYPIIFGQDFIEIMENFPADNLIRSAYCNWKGIPGEQTSDCKFLNSTKPDIVRITIETKSFMSTGEHSIKSIIPILFERFPKKSHFEL